MYTAITILAVLVISSGYFINESFAEVLPNNAFLLEGSGFAVTENFIKISEIDLGISSQLKSGSSINFVTEDGFITLDDDELLISELEGKFLREGRYIRLNGNVESQNGVDTTISFFGRLVEESKEGIIYGFSGRITTPTESYKIIYTAKLSSLIKIKSTPTSSEETSDLTIHILKGAASKGTSNTYIGIGSAQTSSSQNISSPLRLGYFSHDRISVEPGSTIKIINDDSVSHKIISGTENYNDRHNPFTPDGRISTDTIEPGKSVNITFNDAGFYRLYDPDYNWMKIVAYVFPNTDSIILGKGNNLGN
ncbi:MAG: hypothetical protein K5790_08470 [Nitrosopumilus sp.]|uniref:cupredoxin domain-containing protein n=1 Tax=Nitrosopumilus sp. TaxID=2024843 RepID=UPI00247E9312|nr:hypothetical protein [Nitrosopumilus sp.]MCV0393303.1 hypothetical protein [Nitrosopumilus sp.]